MILSDRDIRRRLRLRLQEGGLVIMPFDDAALQPASYDVHLATVLLRPNAAVPNGLTPYQLQPDEFILASTLEHVVLPADLAGQLSGKSTHARRGLIVESAGFVDPGFRGTLTLELKNLSTSPILLEAGMAIAQITLLQLSSPAARPYGTADLGSHYQNQRGPTPAHLP